MIQKLGDLEINSRVNHMNTEVIFWMIQEGENRILIFQSPVSNVGVTRSTMMRAMR